MCPLALEIRSSLVDWVVSKDGPFRSGQFLNEGVQPPIGRVRSNMAGLMTFLRFSRVNKGCRAVLVPISVLTPDREGAGGLRFGRENLFYVRSECVQCGVLRTWVALEFGTGATRFLAYLKVGSAFMF